MSKEAFIKFCKEVVSSDAALIAELGEPQTPSEFARRAVAKGMAAGFEFDAQDAIEVMKAASEKRIFTELTDAQLDGVGGGFASGGGGGAGKVQMQDFHFVSLQDFHFV